MFLNYSSAKCVMFFFCFRYIEGLRDNKPYLSNWSELADVPHQKSQNPLPTHWLKEEHGFESTTEALWALRDHMLRDAVTLSKYA